MHEMEEGLRSGEGLVKKKTSSGCLIIKKKVDRTGGVGTSGSRKVLLSKRQRSVRCDSESSEELLEPYRRKIVSSTDRFRNGSVLYQEDSLEDAKFGLNGGIESDRKRSVDAFDFDQYDGTERKRLREDYLLGRLQHTGRSGSEREFENGSSRYGMIDKRMYPYFDGPSKLSSVRREVPNYTAKSRFEMNNDEAQLPIPSVRHKFRAASFDEPIRLQGKNGVLKVMVNKKNKMKLPQKFYDHQLEVEDGRGSKSENAILNNVAAGRSFYSDSKHPEQAISSFRTKKSEEKPQKILSASANDGNPQKEDSDTPSRLGPATMQAHGSLKGVKNEAEAPSAEKFMPVRGKDGKLKRGNGTEKQLLREKIRKMLVDAGWTIDYRPRRNRDYLDAVYINPSGTAYWSIIKAYDAFQKQLEEEDTGKGVTPLPEELLSKLTRQTRKKIEREMKKKRKDNVRSKNVKELVSEESAESTDGDKDDDKLNFSSEQNGKSAMGVSYGTTNASGDDSSNNMQKVSVKTERAGKASTMTNFDVIERRKSRKIGRCTLLVRRCEKGINSDSDSYVPYAGRRTLLSWLIDSGMVQLREKVQYMNRRRTRVMLEGWITKDGIHCCCCSKILTVSKFEIHAGSKLRQPFPNIYLESGISLLQCQIDAWNRQEESKRSGFQTVDVDGDDPNDDTCGLCGDGGDLICCDGCPSTFHQSCLDIKMLPPGDWHCPNCVCKLCGIAGGDNAHGNGSTSDALLTCSLCEKRYHKSCSQEMDSLPVDENCSSPSFCGHKCQELFDHLQKLIGVKHELEAGFSWTLLRRTDLDTDALHRGFSQRVECNSKLAVALSVMDECFLPIVDRRSGIDLIHNVLYNCGSNFHRLNYSGFYTAILERGDEIISAASIRIHGNQLAEMPFIGTRHIYRRQGMCRLLFCAIGSVLCSLNVEKLIIPAIPEHMHTWTVVFGFNTLQESHKQETRSFNLLVFPGIDMLQKLLVELKASDATITANSGKKPVVIKDNLHLMPDMARESDLDSSAGHDLSMCDNVLLHNVDEMSDEAVALDSSLHAPAIPLNDDAHLNCTSDPPEPRNEKTSLDSQSVGKLTESSVDLKCPSSSDANEVDLEMESSVLNHSFEGKVSAEKVLVQLDETNAEISVDAPVQDLLGETSSSRTAKEIKGDQNSPPKPTVHGTDETTKQLLTDLTPHSSVDTVQELHVASAAPSEAKIESFESSIQYYAEDDAQSTILVEGGFSNTPKVKNLFAVESVMDDSCEVRNEDARVEPYLDCSMNFSAQNEDVNEEQDPFLVSMFNGSDESTGQLNSTVNKQRALEVERELHTASEISADEDVAFVGSNIVFGAEDDASKDVCEVNVGNASALMSSGETTIENTTDEIKDNDAVSIFHGPDSIPIKFESGWNHPYAIENETELHMD